MPQRADAIDVRLRPAVLALVAIGGALGALARYGLGRVIHTPTDGFPRATFVINVSGAFVLGAFLTVVHVRRAVGRYARAFVAVGFLGAFTTFSTMAVETVTLVKDGHFVLGGAYLAVSVVAGIVACALGVVGARAVS
jgi:CrcB protein